jgi:hypothetical protein
MTLNTNKIKSLIAREWLVILSVVIISTLGVVILGITSKPMLDCNKVREIGFSDQDIHRLTGVDIAKIKVDEYVNIDLEKVFKPNKSIPKNEEGKYVDVSQLDLSPVDTSNQEMDEYIKNSIVDITILNTDKSELDLKKTIIYFYILTLFLRFTFWAIKWVRSASKDE